MPDSWRIGKKVPINVYEGDRPICQCQTAVDAARIVAAVNAQKPLHTADRIFRELLFAAHGFGYGDDGEMQGTNGHPIIDFRRDTAEEIQRKIQIRNLAALARARGESDAG